MPARYTKKPLEFIPMKKIVSTIVVLFAAVQIASAVNSFNYFDIGWERTSYKSGAGTVLDDANGLFAELAVAPLGPLFLLGEYHYAKPDTIGEGDLKQHDLRLGAGLGLPLGPIKIYTHLGGRYFKLDPEFTPFEFDDWGFYVEPGARVGFGEVLELYASALYSRINDSNEWGAEAGGIVHFNPNFGVKVMGRFEDEYNTFGIGARIAF